MRQISLCLTNYNRLEVLNAYDKVYADERISEIIISDDASDLELFNKLKDIIEFYPKVKLHRNEKNLGCYYNKKRSVELASNDWCVVLDSDNQIGIDYLDKIFDRDWNDEILFAPDFAEPVFNYTNFSDVILSKENIAGYVNERGLDCLLNTMNYFVNRSKYLEVFEEGIEPYGSDSIHQNYNWIKAGNKIHVLSGLRYKHEVHKGSHYVAHAAISDPLCKNLLNKFSYMK